MENRPFCQKCKYITRWDVPHCKHPKASVFDRVEGPKPIACHEARDIKGPCGLKGELYEEYIPLSEQYPVIFWTLLLGLAGVISFIIYVS